jgi:2,3-bisphosphoglycerate-dependent phosphoglycerate mutase
MAKLFLVRHGKSEWNKLGLWTGWTDVGLDEDGVKEALLAGQALKDEHIDAVYTSELKRTHETFAHLKEAAGKGHLTHTPHKALNERHYGVYTGKNKWQIKEEVGEETFQSMRRGWDVPIPEGETLKDVHARVMPYYEENIKKDLLAGKNVLVVAHGNTLRALAKHLENLSEVDIAEVEFETGAVHLYHLDEEGKVTHKETKKGE